MRGVSIVEILKCVMRKVTGLTDVEKLKPCEYFDMMAGTSTGG